MLAKAIKRRAIGQTSALMSALGVALVLSASAAWAQTGFTYESGIAYVPSGPLKIVNLDKLSAVNPSNARNDPEPESRSSRPAYRAIKQNAAMPIGMRQNAAAPGPTAKPPSAAPGAQVPYVAFDGNQHKECGGSKPDMALAVGSDAFDYYVMQVNNDCISLFTETGTRKSGYPKRMTHLFEQDAFDPRALYDWWLRRYVLVAAGRNGKYWIAVSKENDPAGDYYVYIVPMPSGRTDNAFPDFPRLGQDHDFIYIASNKVGDKSYQNEEWLLLPKEPLYTGQSLQYRYVHNTAVNGLKTDTSQPAVVSLPTESPPVAFFVSSKTRKVGGGYLCKPEDPPCNGLLVWAVVGNPSATHPLPLVSGVAVPTANDYSMPPSVPSKDGHLDTGDTSISGQVTYTSVSGGTPSLFASLTTKDRRGDQAIPIASALLFKIKPQLRQASRPDCRDPSCMIISSAKIADETMIAPEGKNSSFYATMLPDLEDNTVTVYNLTGPDYYPSVAYISRSAAGQFVGTRQLVRAGQSRYGDRWYWGDYTAVAPRPPKNPGTKQGMWFAGEYAGPERDYTEWRTVVGNTTFPGTTQPR